MNSLLVCDWHHSCGDGCCDEYGSDLYANGDLAVKNVEDNQVEALTTVLTMLKVPFVVKYIDEEELYPHK